MLLVSYVAMFTETPICIIVYIDRYEGIVDAFPLSTVLIASANLTICLTRIATSIATIRRLEERHVVLMRDGLNLRDPVGKQVSWVFSENR